jgi:transcriptional regulator with XRE-family HTH domain
LTQADEISKISCMAKKQAEDPSMAKVRKAVEGSEYSRQQIGEKMGYEPQTARQAISQLLRTSDPRIGTLRRLAKALGVKLDSLI